MHTQGLHSITLNPSEPGYKLIAVCSSSPVSMTALGHSIGLKPVRQQLIKECSYCSLAVLSMGPSMHWIFQSLLLESSSLIFQSLHLFNARSYNFLEVCTHTALSGVSRFIMNQSFELSIISSLNASQYKVSENCLSSVN